MVDYKKKRKDVEAIEHPESVRDIIESTQKVIKKVYLQRDIINNIKSAPRAKENSGKIYSSQKS